jgi:hypothetical protein
MWATKQLHEYASAVSTRIGAAIRGWEQFNCRPAIVNVPGHGHDSSARSFPDRSSAASANGFIVDPGGSGDRVVTASFRIATTRAVRRSSTTAAGDGPPAASNIAISSLRRMATPEF